MGTWKSLPGSQDRRDIMLNHSQQTEGGEMTPWLLALREDQGPLLGPAIPSGARPGR